MLLVTALLSGPENMYIHITMNKFITALLLIVILMYGGTAFAQLIPWKAGYFLTWDDFQGPPAQSEFSAETRWDYRYNYKWSGDGKITVDVVCSFDKQKSWKKPERNLTPKLLLHEQLHFYAAEIFARKMRQSFAAYIASHKHDANTVSDLNGIFNTVKSECDSYQSQYDTATNHGRDDNAQEEWKKKIVADLNALAAFEKK